MSGLFGIATSALRANQQALATVGQNIANVNTEGYARQRLNLSTAAGAAGGVAVLGVERSYSEWASASLLTAQGGAGAASAKASALSRLETAFAVDETSLSAAFGRFQDALATLSAQPTVSGVRTTVFEEARTVAARFQSMDRQLENLEGALRTEMGATVERINGYATELAQLNQALRASGSSPALEDQKEQLLNKLAFEVGARPSRQGDGAVDLYLPSGQPLVRADRAFPLEAAQGFVGPFTPRITVAGSGRDASFGLQGGRLGGLLEALDAGVTPRRRELGQLAEAYLGKMNQLHAAGFTAAGEAGGALFSGLEANLALKAAPGNTGDGAFTVSIATPSALQATAYELTVEAGNQVTVRRLTDGAVAYAGPLGDLSSAPLDGLTFSLDSGTPSAGDRYRVDPLTGAAGRVRLALASPSELAMNRAEVSATLSGTITATVEPVQGLSAPFPGDPALLELTVADDGSGGLVLTDGAGNAQSFTPGAPVTFEPYGVSLTISSALVGARIELKAQSAGAADGGQARLLSDDLPIFASGESAGDGYGAVLGAAAGASNRADLEAQAAELSVADASARREALTGVNLDEEAADLLRFQQAYQAAARVITVADSLFQSLLAVVR